MLAGFVVEEEVFSPEHLQPCRDAVERLVGEFAQHLYGKGKIQTDSMSQNWDSAPFIQRKGHMDIADKPEVDNAAYLKTAPTACYSRPLGYPFSTPMRLMVVWNLPNLSTDIRWSLDLRWHAPVKPDGFYGIRQGVLMRSAKDPDLKVKWDALQEKEKKLYDTAVDEFDTTMPGPWMANWDIPHANRHTARFHENNKLKP